MAGRGQGSDRRRDLEARGIGGGGGSAARGACEPYLVLAVPGEEGALVLPAPEDPVEFASLLVGPAEVPASYPTGPEVILGAVVIRLEVNASAERIAAVARALAAGS